MAFEDELLAFQKYAEALPGNCIFMVDTYDTEAGVQNAIRIGKGLREQGYGLNGIRLDSGDLAALSKIARRMLDEAGFTKTAIVASNDLDEYRIAQLKKEGAKITVWGVGTRLATAHDDPALGGVYKLSAIQNEQGAWDNRIKRSEEAIKASNPGRLQVWRSQGGGDVLYDIQQGLQTGQMWNENTRQSEAIDKEDGIDLLVPVLDRGQLVYDFPELPAVRSYALSQWQQFAQQQQYPYGLSQSLQETKAALMEEAG
jgi:nicotinate phosphoribosyltransferase